MNSEKEIQVRKDTDKMRRPSFFSGPFFPVVLTVIIIVTAISFVAYNYAEKMSRERRQMYMFSGTKATKRQIQNWYNDIIDKCNLIILNHKNESNMYAAIVSKYSAQRNSRISPHNGFRNYLNDIKKSISCKSVMMATSEGSVIDSTDEVSGEVDKYLKQTILAALESKKVMVAPVKLNETDRKSYISFVLPFFSALDSKGTETGISNNVLIVTYDIEKELSGMLYSLDTSRSKSFEELIVMQKGDNLVILNKLIPDSRRWMTLVIPMTGVNSPSYSVLQGNDGVFNGIDYRGCSVISTAAYIPELKWGLIEKIDRIDAFNILRTIMLFIVGVSLFIIFFMGWFFMRYAKKRGESATHKIEKLEQYRSALLSVYPDIIVNVDMKGKINWLNERGTEFFGVNAIDKDISSFMTGMSRDVVKEHYYDFLFSGKKTNVTSVQLFRRKDGNERVLSWTSCFLVDDDGNKTGVLAAARDITESKEAEKKIEESEKYLKTIFSSLIDGIVIIDKDMNITDANEYIYSLLGYFKDELIGEKLFKIYPDAGYGLLKKSIERHFEDEVSISGLEIDLLTKSGETVPTSIKAVLLRDYEGKVFGSLGLIRDMREVKVLQQTLVQSEKLSSVGEMAAGVAHELNNPLTAIIGYSNLLMDKDIPEEIAKQIEIINQQSQRCQNIVSNLLMFSRRYEAKKDSVDLNELAKTTIALTAYDMRSSGITIEEKYEDGLPLAFIDGNKIQQVLVNLFQNARYAVEQNENGEKKIGITTKKQNNLLEIEVSDTGIGIGPEKIQKIFDPFYTTKKVGEGTGLGLSISYGIIKEHGGDIYVRSKPGKGTQFVIKLPFGTAGEKNAAKIEKGDVEEVEFRKKTVLVIDDEEVIRDVLNLYLSDEGHAVDSTESAIKALEMIKRKNYDMIFSDVRMPDMNGLKFLEKLKGINEPLAQKVVFITGDSMSLDSIGNGNGFKNLILTKPFTINDVKGVLQKVV